jgi:hypothetical protein
MCAHRHNYVRWRVFDVAEYTGGQFAIEPIGAELARLAAFSDFKPCDLCMLALAGRQGASDAKTP